MRTDLCRSSCGFQPIYSYGGKSLPSNSLLIVPFTAVIPVFMILLIYFFAFLLAVFFPL